jgi:hypothetical protein
LKRLLLLALPLLLIAPSAQGAIIAKPMSQLAQVDELATGIVAFGSQIAVFGNRDKNGFVQFVNGTTVELSCGVESFVSAATTDVDGNFYFAGAASTQVVGTLPPVGGVLNPDNVIPDPVGSSKSDATTLCLWKLDSSGKVLDNSTALMQAASIPNSIIVDKFGTTVSGTSAGNNGFVLNWGGKATNIGKQSTEIFGTARTADGGVVAVGQSGEKLLDKTLKGKSDGFLAKVLNGKLISVQRSSDLNSNRSWRSASSTLLLGGNSNSTAVITKFTSNFTPTWTDRYPSNGSALTTSVGKVNYGAFISTGAFKALPTWKSKNKALILTLDSKGLITAANYANTAQINGFTATSSLGPLLLAGGFLYRA